MIPIFHWYGEIRALNRSKQWIVLQSKSFNDLLHDTVEMTEAGRVSPLSMQLRLAPQSTRRLRRSLACIDHYHKLHKTASNFD